MPKGRPRKPSEELNKEPTKEAPLNIAELFKKSGVKLHIFIGTLVYAGKQQDYDRDVEMLKQGIKPAPMMSLSEFNKYKENFLNKRVK